MRFRTEIEPISPHRWINTETSITLLGSCFADNIGQMLERDGFHVLHNPAGPLFNPLSMANMLQSALTHRRYCAGDFVEGPRGFHCLDYASQFSGTDAVMLAQDINERLDALAGHLNSGTATCPNVLVLTFGSAFVYWLDGNKPVGNCHKFPAQRFQRRRLTVDQCVHHIKDALALTGENTRVILTVSPVRHLDDGLHGNTLSKSILHLACEQVADGNQIVYFPAYEMIVDDLRDYRFYADDLKHPSTMACDYIYEHFCRTFTDKHTIESAQQNRKSYALRNHRPILS